MKRSKGSFGTEFTTGNVLQIFLLLIGVFLVTGIIISATGGIQGMLEKLCEAVPQLCGEESTSSEYYQISKQSTASLWHAADIVMTGERKHPDVTYTSLSLTGAATASFEGEEAEEFKTIEFETTGVSNAPPTDNRIMALCEEKCGQQTTPCDCVSCDNKGSKLYGSVYTYEIECRVISLKEGEEDKSSVFCDVRKGYPELEYEEDRGILSGKRSNVWYTFDSGEWKWKCPDESFEEYESVIQMNGILNDVDPVHTEIGKELIAIDPSFSDEEKYRKGLDVLRDAVLSDNHGNDDKIKIHYASKEKPVEIDKKDLRSNPYMLNDLASLNRNSYAKCIVKNFHLPQDVTKAEEWIAGYGDPEFLVYWQKFPEGEDRSWTGFSTWMSNVFTVVLWGLPVSEFIGAGKNFVVGGAKKIASNLAEKSTGLLGKLMKKIAGKEFTNMGDDVAIFVFKEGIKRDVDKQLIKLAHETYGSEQIAKKIINREVATGLAPGQEMLVREGMEEGVELIGRGSYSEGVTIIGQNFEKIPDAEKAGIMNKFMATKGATKDFTPKWEDYKKIMKIAGVTTGAALLGAFIDSVNAKYEEHPRSILLKSPYKDPEPHLLEKERPLVLYKGQFTGKIGLTENYVPFYLASPCQADLELTKKETVCENYIKDLADESIICTSPGKQTVFESLFNEAERCEYFPTNVDQDNFKVPFLSNEAKLKETGLESKLLFGKETVGGEEMDVIYDPINELDYYFNRNTNQIEYMGYTEGNQRKTEKLEDIKGMDVTNCGLYPNTSSLFYSDQKADFDYLKSITGYEGDEIFGCELYLTQFFKEQGGNDNVYDARTKVYIYGNLTERDKKLESFSWIVIKKQGLTSGGAGAVGGVQYTPTTIILLTDEDDDNILDVLGHHVLNEKSGDPPEFISLTNRTFTKGMESGTNCKTDSVLVTVNQMPYENGKNNFCFTTHHQGMVTVIFVGSAVADVIAGIATSGASTLIAHTAIGVAGGTSVIIARSVNEWP